MSTFVHFVADYGKSDPAFSEVVHRLHAELDDVQIQSTAVPPLSTVATGFWIEQLTLHNPAFDDLLLYSNTAPRATADAQQETGGGDLCYLRLTNGVPVVAVDAGYNLSFVRDHVEEFRTVEIPDGGSQFRSRDYFPQRVAEIAAGDRSSLGSTRSTADIPAKPASVVCHVDGYGNVKTSIRASAFDFEGEEVRVTVGGETTTVAVTDTVSDIEAGALGIVPGSAGGADPYMELFLRGGSAATHFDDPRPGDEVSIA